MQIHSKHHLSPCFKYRQRGSGKDACRFGMPRNLVPASKVDEIGLIHLARNHAWTNPWNPAIASCVRSNHDISWIPTVSKTLSLIYYITNYATKDDVSPWQMVAKAALVKERIERAKTAELPTRTDLRLREKGFDNFALRCFNTLSHDREISGVQVASTLLNLPTHYTISHFHPHQSVLKNHVPMKAGATAPVSIFDNYKLRGQQLGSLALFEYCMLVRTTNVRDAIADDVDFDPSHPQSNSHVQRLARTSAQVATVIFNGQITEFQASEDAVPGEHANSMLTKRDACSRVWKTVEPTLVSHLRTFAANIELLRKPREDSYADAKLRQAPIPVDSLFDRDVDELEIDNVDSDSDDSFMNLDESVSIETLIAAYHSIANRWDREMLVATRRIPSLVHAIPQNRGPPLLNHLPLNLIDNPAYGSSGLTSFPPSMLQQWETRLKELAKLVDHGHVQDAEMGPAYELDDFTLDIADSILEPMLTEPEAIPTPPDHGPYVAGAYTPISLTSLVNETIPLNTKQRLVVEKVLREALTWADHPYDASHPAKRVAACLDVDMPWLNEE
ncbi:Pc17g00330 [Aspergillus udagawae]|nr:Pc17g00330 [Aspergillus udagawae]